MLAAATAAAEPAAPIDPPNDPGETIVVVDPGARDRDRALGDAPFVTIIHPDDHPATDSVADAVANTVGAQVTSLGGLGSYQSLSVRGTSPGHTQVLIDGIPLARIASVTTDLGQYELGAFGEVDLYRGAVPVELGGAGVGGALDLITRLGPGADGSILHASIGAGSFGARHLRVHYGDAHLGGRLLSSTTIGYQGATGDYSFYNDNGTPLNQADDTTATRHNNGFDQVDAQTRVGNASGSASGGLRASWKQQGVPGSPTAPALQTTLHTLDVIGDARGTVDVGPAAATELAYVLVQRQRFDDPNGELGLGDVHQRTVTASGGGSSTWKFPVAGARGVAGVEVRGDHYTSRDDTGIEPAVIGTRLGGAVSAAVDVPLDRARTVVITPAFRFDALRTAPPGETVGLVAPTDATPRWDELASPRISALVAVLPELSIKGSAGEYARLPTLVEVFGDRAYTLGSPALRPEHGPAADLGVVWAPARALGPVDRVLVEADGFATYAHDTIAFIRTLGYVARAENVGDSASHGAEVAVSGRLARVVTLTANYTWLVTAQDTADPTYDHKALPREPGGQLYVRADLAERVLDRVVAAWVDTSWQATSYLDPANHQAVPARTLIGVGLRVPLVAGVALALSVHNLANVRVEQLPLDPAPSPELTHTPTALADVAGFPLPGRSLYAALDWTH